MSSCAFDFFLMPFSLEQFLSNLIKLSFCLLLTNWLDSAIYDLIYRWIWISDRKRCLFDLYQKSIIWSIVKNIFDLEFDQLDFSLHEQFQFWPEINKFWFKLRVNRSIVILVKNRTNTIFTERAQFECLSFFFQKLINFYVLKESINFDSVTLNQLKLLSKITHFVFFSKIV